MSANLLGELLEVVETDEAFVAAITNAAIGQEVRYAASDGYAPPKRSPRPSTTTR